MLKMEQIEAIKRMSQSESISTIARTLGIDWKTAQKYVDKDDFNEAVKKKVVHNSLIVSFVINGISTQL